jgi:hypothetical protein
MRGRGAVSPSVSRASSGTCSVQSCFGLVNRYSTPQKHGLTAGSGQGPTYYMSGPFGNVVGVDGENVGLYGAAGMEV